MLRRIVAPHLLQQQPRCCTPLRTAAATVCRSFAAEPSWNAGIGKSDNAVNATNVGLADAVIESLAERADLRGPAGEPVRYDFLGHLPAGLTAYAVVLLTGLAWTLGVLFPLGM